MGNFFCRFVLSIIAYFSFFFSPSFSTSLTKKEEVEYCTPLIEFSMVLSVDVPLGSLARSYFDHIDGSCSGLFGAGYEDRGEFLQGITDCATII